MLGLTEEETRSALTQYSELHCEGRRLCFANAEAPSISLDLRVKEPHQLVYLARLLAHLGYDEVNFSHAHLWVTTWGVWGKAEEAIGFKTLEQFRCSYGENRSLKAAPGHYFRHDEFTESVCCLLPSMMVGWDAYYVPHWDSGYLEYFLTVSHDSFVDIEVRTKETHDRALGILSEHEWLRPLLRAES
jgi:hypothetical protein